MSLDKMGADEASQLPAPMEDAPYKPQSKVQRVVQGQKEADTARPALGTADIGRHRVVSKPATTAISSEDIRRIFLQFKKTNQKPADHIIKELERVGPTIESLDLHGQKVTVQDIQSLATQFPNVKKLSLKGCALTDECIQALKKFKKLEGLDVGGNKDLTPKSIGLLSEMSSLKELFCIDCPGLIRFDERMTSLEAYLQGDQGFSMTVSMALAALINSKSTVLSEQEKLLGNVFSRAYQLIHVRFEDNPLSLKEAFQIAFFVEVRLPKYAAMGIRYFKQKAYKLPRTLQYSPIEGGRVYLLSKYKKSIFKGEGTSKKVSSAVELVFKGFSKTPPIRAHAMTRGLIDGWVMTPDNYKSLLREAEIGREFAASPHIVHLHTIETYKAIVQVPQKGPQEIQKLSFIMDAYDGSIQELFEATKKLPQQEMITLAKGAGSGIRDLHAKGYVHGDLKNLNILFIRNPVTKELEKVAVGDLGFAFKFGQDKATFTYGTGYYGSILFTPPELFGNRSLRFGSVEEYQKMDVFALGFVLYQQFFKKDPPWANDILQRYNSDFTLGRGSGHVALQRLLREQQRVQRAFDTGVDQDRNKVWAIDEKVRLETLKCEAQDLKELKSAQKLVRDKIQQYVEKPFAALQAKANRTAEEEMQFLIYKTLRYNPKDRIDMNTYMDLVSKFN